MLRWSIEENEQQNRLASDCDRGGDPLIRGGTGLIEYVNATLSARGIASAREAVVTALGSYAAVDAAAVIGNFEMMNRIADGVGMPVSAGTRRAMAGVIEQLGLAGFPHA